MKQETPGKNRTGYIFMFQILTAVDSASDQSQGNLKQDMIPITVMKWSQQP